MAVNDTPRRAGPFTGNGVTTVFPFTFKVLAGGDLRVATRAPTGLFFDVVDPDSYTVSGVGDDEGGSITFSTPLADQHELVILGAAPYDQQLTLFNQGPYFAEDVMRALDRGVVLTQQLKEVADRAVVLPEDAAETPRAFAESLFNARGGAETAAALATEAKGDAEAAAVLAQSAYQGRQYVTRAEAATDITVNGYDPVAGTVITAGGLQYVRTIGADGIVDMPGWQIFAVATYDTFAQFEADNDAGVLSGLASGDVVIVAGRTLVRENAQTFIPGLPNWRDTWMRQKHLLTADWQPLPGQEPRLKSVMDSIASRHPDLTHAHFCGDLIEEGSTGTGAEPPYGFPEFLADWRDRLPIPLRNAFFLPGNHERDGTGAGSHEKAWSLQSYRKWIGREFYATLQGNLLMVYMGDMGGSVGGAISNDVVAWFRDLVLNNTDKNIIVNLHQPLSGTYRGSTEETSPTGFQILSVRITDILDEVAAGANNIAAVFYGHVNSQFQFNDEVHHGTRHVQIGMHIPANVSNDRNDQYYVMDFVHGASAFNITHWDATADVQLEVRSFDFKYPLQLSADFALDGRYSDEDLKPSTKPHRVLLPCDDYRVLDGGTWVMDTSTPVWLYSGAMEDRSLDTVPAGFSVGYGVGFPGVNVIPAGAWDLGAINSVAVDVGIAWEKKSGSDNNPTVSATIYTSTTGTVKNPVWFWDRGIAVGHDATVNTSPGQNSNVNGSVYANTYHSIYNPNGHCAFWGRGTTGSILNMYLAGSLRGNINITSVGADYNTTSDKRLKNDPQEFDALATILALEVWDHAWVGKDERSRGVMAQDAYAVAPYAVTVGGDNPDTDPWAVDYSKFVPDLIRAVQQLSEIVAAQAKRIGALEAQGDE